MKTLVPFWMKRKNHELYLHSENSSDTFKIRLLKLYVHIIRINNDTLVKRILILALLLTAKSSWPTEIERDLQ